MSIQRAVVRDAAFLGSRAYSSREMLRQMSMDAGFARRQDTVAICNQ